MSTFKKIVIWILTGVMLLTLVGCSNKDNKKHYVAMITKSTKSAFWQSVFAGASAAATEYNLSISYDGPELEEDYEYQNNLIYQAIEDGAEAIIFSAVDYNANAKAIEDASKKGLKVIIIDSDVNSNQVSCRIGTDNYAAGCMAGEAALASNEEKIHIGIVNYDINSANGQQREDGFRDTVSKDSRVKDIVTINVVSTTEDARKGTKQLLEEHPEINVIATFNEWTSLGVGWAIRDLNLADETTVVAFDSNVVSVGMLETGEVDALIVQNPYAMGYLGVEKVAELIRGQNIEKGTIDTSTTLITRDNMYDAEYQKILFSFH
ncbi:substrate-binding domain-containing protein [Lachnoclostridium sp.]|uniref:substrate-binding domain-containing protein n=1 Tax=Lachnoclostridium sp. TaxID=2028282 RepID=UPI00289DC447|nr:substrate-binding domain-containing protein [Lachnoclostridium sp.]